MVRLVLSLKVRVIVPVFAFDVEQYGDSARTIAAHDLRQHADRMSEPSK